MILTVVLAALLLLFFLVKHNVGIPFLAMIAGTTVYSLFGEGFAETINTWIPAIDVALARNLLYALFIVVVPILLYFRSGKSGLFGAMRMVESVIFALLMTIMMSSILADIFYFDPYAHDLASWIVNIQTPLMVVGVILAYVDAFFYRSGQLV